MSLKTGFEVTKTHKPTSLLDFFSSLCCGSDVALDTAPVPCLPIGCHVPCHDGHGLTV